MLTCNVFVSYIVLQRILFNLFLSLFLTSLIIVIVSIHDKKTTAFKFLLFYHYFSDSIVSFSLCLLCIKHFIMKHLENTIHKLLYLQIKKLVHAFKIVCFKMFTTESNICVSHADFLIGSVSHKCTFYFICKKCAKNHPLQYVFNNTMSFHAVF